MNIPKHVRLPVLVLTLVAVGCAPEGGTPPAEPAAESAAAPLQLNLRSRAAGPETSSPVVRAAEWAPRETAAIVIDVWDQHWCAGASRRVAEMAPRLDQLLGHLRSQGVLIIHAPSGTMDFYEGTPQRERARQAPFKQAPVDVATWCNLLPEREPELPVDASDGGCDCQPQCEQHSAWTRQFAGVAIEESDAVSDNGQEIYNLLEQHGIRNVLIAGVHTNMCVLGRPFGIRRMVSQGRNVALIRDLTDTMYNPRMAPLVPHVQGTDLVVEHIEKYWCPSVTSVDFIGGSPFRFSEDTRPVEAPVKAVSSL